MRTEDRAAIITRYRSFLRQHGPSSAALGWGFDGKQDIRFRALTQPIRGYPNASILDVGCGFADLYRYLLSVGWRGRYAGVDLVHEFVSIAQQRYPEVGLTVGDVDSLRGTWDFVVASGTFNTRLTAETGSYIAETIRHMFDLATLAVCVDFLSSHCDYRDERAWHTDPTWALDLGLSLSSRVQVSHAYLPFEFCLIVFKDIERPTRRRAYRHRYPRRADST